MLSFILYSALPTQVKVWHVEGWDLGRTASLNKTAKERAEPVTYIGSALLFLSSNLIHSFPVPPHL